MAEHKRYIIQDREQSPVAEAFRTLRASIQAAQNEGELKTVLITSAGASEGKSMTAANMALTLAYSGKRVILLDCDLRKPVQGSIFGLKDVGITNVLTKGWSVDEVIQDTKVANLKVIASGSKPDKPAELLSHEKMRDTLSYLKTKADLVIIDSPPLVNVADACILASKVDGVALVLDAGAVRKEMALRARDLLAGTRARIIGVILNQVEIDEELLRYDD